MAFLGTTIAQASQRLRSPRQHTLIKANITSDCLPQQPVVVRNVSASGLGMTTHGVLPRVDEQITVHFTNGISVTGQVKWVEGRNFGTKLDHTISLADLELATQRKKAISNKACSWQVEDRYVRTPPAPSTYRACFV